MFLINNQRTKVYWCFYTSFLSSVLLILITIKRSGIRTTETFESAAACFWPVTAGHQRAWRRGPRSLARTGAPLILQERLRTEAHRITDVFLAAQALKKRKKKPLTFPDEGWKARRQRERALLTSFVFFSRGQLITWVCRKQSGTNHWLMPCSKLASCHV